jgi:BOP1NT (NUC169) domain
MPHKRKLHFLPQKYKSLRGVLYYDRFTRKRFLRCLDCLDSAARGFDSQTTLVEGPQPPTRELYDEGVHIVLKHFKEVNCQWSKWKIYKKT